MSKKKLLMLVYWLAVFCIFQSMQYIASQNVVSKTNVHKTSAFFTLIRNLLESANNHICHNYNTFLKSIPLNCGVSISALHPYISPKHFLIPAGLKGIRIPATRIDNADNKYTFNLKVIMARTAG